MRIGYPCINRSIGCRGDRTFRLASYSEDRFIATVESNLSCLKNILTWNREYGLLFFRITSDLIPFASHPVCTFPWQEYFRDELTAIGRSISGSGIRISMHPDQFIILNSPEREITLRSVAELRYHADLLDAMGLDSRTKIQLHIGGVYGERERSRERFIRRWADLDPPIQKRLVIENDEQRFAIADCLAIREETGIPVLFDVFHHRCYNHGEPVPEVLARVSATWRQGDGTMMVDYSSQHPGKRRGAHAEHIDTGDFLRFLDVSAPYDMDIMLEIKDKEASAVAAIDAAGDDPRLVRSVPVKW
jgi:UV DNA damage endonuclease